MFRWFKRHEKVIFWSVAICFFATIPLYFGAGGTIGVSGPWVAKVNGKKISLSRFQKLYSRYLERLREEKPERELSGDDLQRIRQEVLRDLISEEALYQEAMKYGFRAADQEVALSIASLPIFQDDQGRFNFGLYNETLRWRLRQSRAEFEEERRRALLIGKLQNLWASTASRFSEAEARMEYERRHPNGNWQKERQKFLETYRQERIGRLFSAWQQRLGQRVRVEVNDKLLSQLQ